MFNCWLCGSFYQTPLPPPLQAPSVTQQLNYLTFLRAADMKRGLPLSVSGCSSFLQSCVGRETRSNSAA